MRIPIIVRQWGSKEELIPFISFSIRSAKFRCFAHIEAIVDTGSPHTTISPRDLLRINIPISRLPLNESTPTIALVGLKFYMRKISNVILHFRSENNDLRSYDLEFINGLEPTRSDEETKMIIKYIPSIIGMDFLQKYKIALYFDPANKRGYLETGE